MRLETKVDNLTQIMTKILSKTSDSGPQSVTRDTKGPDTPKFLSNSPASFNEAAESLPAEIDEPDSPTHLITTSDQPKSKARWKSKLDRKSKPTARAYKRYIEEFIQIRGKSSLFK